MINGLLLVLLLLLAQPFISEILNGGNTSAFMIVLIIMFLHSIAFTHVQVMILQFFFSPGN